MKKVTDVYVDKESVKKLGQNHRMTQRVITLFVEKSHMTETKTYSVQKLEHF